MGFFAVASRVPLNPNHSHFLKLNSTRFFCRFVVSKDLPVLDPPPVAGLRIYDVQDNGDGTAHEAEVDYRWTR